MAAYTYKTQTADEVLQRLNQGEPLTIVDVRELEEWNAGHIPGIKLIPLSEFVERVGEIDSKQETIIVCRSGARSGRACEYLEQFGYSVVNMVGGMLAWRGNIVYGD
jgi:rhodanese-related sulfurtransferase